MQLLAIAAFEPFLAGAQREQPIRAHLNVVVTRFQRLVIERIIAVCGVARRPNQGLVRIGEAAAAKIRHRIRFAPDDIVQDPKAEILEDRADPENVVVGTDDPERGGGLHQTAGGKEPGAGEIVICGETREFVPVVVDRVDAGIVGAFEIALELEIVRRIGEHQIDGSGRQLCHFGNAIADQDARRRGRVKTHAGRPDGRPATRHNHDSGL